MIVVKVGSSLVADTHGQIRQQVLRGIAREAVRVPEPVIVVSSGAIAIGGRLIGETVRPRSMPLLQASSAVGQGKVYQAWEAAFRTHTIATGQLLLTQHDLTERLPYLNARTAFQALLAKGVVPVVNENDATATDEISFGDNDFLAARIAVMMEARLLLILTDTHGVYDRDPRDPDAQLLHEIKEATPLDTDGASGSAWSRGGMGSKVQAARMCAASGLDCVITNGTDSQAIQQALTGAAVGTRFIKSAERTNAFKAWLRWAKPVTGAVEIDEGAAHALRTRGASLLAVGITNVVGDFSRGDAVEIRRAGESIAKGIITLGAHELGADSSGEAVIHRDFLVLY